MTRGMVYKIFSSFVAYSEPSQGMDEVVMDTSSMEGTAMITLKQCDGQSACHPCWIDALCHLSGFLLKSSELSPPDVKYICNGWKSMRILSSLQAGSRVRNHVRMQPVDKRGTKVEM